MLAPAIGLLSVGLWLGYLTIRVRAVPALKTMAQRSAHRGSP